MTSFKILRGLAKDLPASKIDGRAYFCTDTGELYIDYKDNSNTVQRKLVNAEEFAKKANLTHAAQHKIGGSDAIAPSDIGAAESGVVNSHIGNKSNPHGVTKSQVGLGSVVNTGDSATPVSGGTTKFTTGGAYTELAKKVDKTTTINDKALSGNITLTPGDVGAAEASVVTNHIDNKSNPHGVTKSQIGLSSVVNTGDSATPVSGGTTKFTTGGAYTELAKKVDKTTTINNKALSGDITLAPEDIGAADSGAFSSHVDNKNNPHSVTKSQIGLGSVVNTGDSDIPTENGTKKFTTGGAYIELAKKVDKTTTINNKALSGDITLAPEDIGAADASVVTNHIDNTTNPHNVTKSQVGLGNVANERQYSVNNPPPAATESAAGLMSAADKKKLNAIAAGATANVGDITAVIASNGLQGGATSGEATLSVKASTGISVSSSGVAAKLRSDTALGQDSVAATTTANRVYPVAVDKSGYLAVNVPWTDTNTHAVTSVNGETGAVTLTAADVNALAAGTKYAGASTAGGSATSAEKVNHTLTINGTTFDGSADATVTIGQMTGASSSAAGTKGLVPAPAAGAQSKFLRGDGTWQSVPQGDITAVTAGNGLQGGATSGAAALSVGEGTGIIVEADTVSVNTGYTTSGKNYAVKADETSGGLYVNVPWTDTNTHAVSSVNSKTGAVVLTAADVNALPAGTTYAGSSTAGGPATSALTATTAASADKVNHTFTVQGVSFDGSADKNVTINSMTAASSSAAGKSGLVPAPAAGAQSKFLRGDGTWQSVGDITKVTAGNGLSGGAASGEATLSVKANTGISVSSDGVAAKLRNSTALTQDSAAATTTENRVYPVAVDKSGYLAVNVPWTDTNTHAVTSVNGETGAVTLTAADVNALPSGTKYAASSSVAGAANKVANKLTVGSKTYDGSAAVSITASDLGLSQALKFVGTTTTALIDGDTTSTIIVNNNNHTASTGDVVLYEDQEFVWTGSKWEELGNASSHSKVGHTHVVNGTVSQPTFTGKAASHNHSFSGTGVYLSGAFTGTQKTLSTKYTPAGSISQSTFTGTAGTATADYTPAGTVSAPVFSGTTATIKANYTPAGTINELTFGGTATNSAGPSATTTVASQSHTHSVTGTVSQPTFTGTEATINSTFTPSGSITKPVFTGTAVTSGTSSSNADVAAQTHTHTVTGTVSKPTFEGSGVIISGTFQGEAINPGVSYTPAGSVSKPTFSSGSAAKTGTTGTSVATAGHTHSYTPAGTISTPTITVTPTTTTVYSITGVGSVPALTYSASDASKITGWTAGNGSFSASISSTDASVANKVVTLSHGHTVPTLTYGASDASTISSWSAGSKPTRSSKTVVTGIDSATSTQPTFTGTAATIAATADANKVTVAAQTHTHTVTGTVSQPTFTGTAATISHSFTPAGTITITAATPGSGQTANYTPSGTVSQPTFSSGTAAKTGTTKVTVAKSNHTHSVTAEGTINDLEFTGENGVATATYTPSGTVSQPTFSSGTAAKTSTTAATVPSQGHTHSVTATGVISQPEFTGTAATISAEYTPEGGNTAPVFSGTKATINSSYTPAGIVSRPSFSGTETTISYDYTPQGGIVISSTAPTTANPANYTPQGTVGSKSITPEGTVSQPTFSGNVQASST